jgi:uncharacterized protein YprB with RNaseH-like and TPR domain
MKRPERVLLWDIEATNLVADYGRLLCISYKWLGEDKVHTLKVRNTKEWRRDRTDDSGILNKFSDLLGQADLHVFWFGEYFDLPFVQTRLMMNNLKPLPNIPFIDGWKIARKKLKLRSNRLDAVSKLIPIPKDIIREEKLHPEPIHWVRANAGYVDAMKIIEERCESDVKVLEQIYLAIRPYSVNPPNLAKIRHPELEGCPACGDKRVIARGYRIYVRNKVQRFQCQECGHWFCLPLRANK